ncbi:hypothetical protein [Sediminibacterium soli]|uniref:hypothetical protein n=1 Tax=Sediminibacterium soli TaxID=2698829 RepID=UPI001379637F|nr:hypothetical protein [Sediminibacterium soli]NCI46472.1 hypothetical protein [Sediminibacterium soli]
MNIVNKFFLWLLLLPAAFYRRLGVDTRLLKAVLRVKLVMDDRRAPAIGQYKQKKAKPPRFATIGTMIFSAVLGALYLFAFQIGRDYSTRLTIYFFIYIFMLASILISDFTHVLIDVRDNLIILPKPINDRTFLLSRLLHIVIHVSKMILPMSLPAMIYIGIVFGIKEWLSFSVLIVCATLFTIFLINALYVLILKLTTPDKFKSLLGYFQIFFAIFVYGGYQLVPRLLNKVVLNGYSILDTPLRQAAPPYWFAAAWQYIKDGNWVSSLGLYLVLSLLLPVVCIVTVIRYFAPSFNQKLSMISGSDQESAVVVKARTSRNNAGYLRRVSSIVTKKGTERMAFLLTWRITSRSRDFKMKVYPSLGYIFVYLVVIIAGSKRISWTSLQNDPAVAKMLFFFLIYFSSYALIMAIYQLVYSDKYKAAWIYHITPVLTPGELISGAYKASMVKFLLPVAVLFSLPCIWLLGPANIPNILLGVSNQVVGTSLIAYLSLRELPFSQPQAANSKGGNFLRGLLSLAIPACLGFAHYFLFDYTIAVVIMLLMSMSAAWMCIDGMRNKTWEKIVLTAHEG